MNILETVKISLAAARKNANMKQAEVAEEMGVSPQTILNWENGHSEPTVSQFRRICGIYRLPMECVFLPEKSN